MDEVLEEVDELDEVDESNAFEDLDDDDDRPRKKKKRKKRRSQENPLTTFFRDLNPTRVLMIITGLCLVCMVLGFFIPQFTIPPLLIGLLMIIAAHLWQMVIVAQEGIGHLFLWLVCGPYWVIFLITHFEQCKFVIALLVMGTLITLGAFSVMAFHQPVPQR